MEQGAQQQLHEFKYPPGAHLKSKVSPYRTAEVFDCLYNNAGDRFYYMAGALLGYDYDGGLEPAEYVESNYTQIPHYHMERN